MIRNDCHTGYQEGFTVSTKAVIVTMAVAFLLLCFSGLSYAQIPESIKSFYHSDKELGIKVVTGRNVQDIKKLESEPASARIVVVQASREQLTPDLVTILMNWVKQGGTLWFYDSRLADFFAMEAMPLSSDGLNHKKMEGEYGDTKKYPGIAVLGNPYGDHPVLTGVTGAVIFAIEVGKDQYSAVSARKGTKALLKTDLTKDVAVSALREEGKGMVVFKPLLWESQVDGARFQGNLKEYSAGLPIPKITTKQSKITDEHMIEKKDFGQKSLVDIVHLADGRIASGKVLTESITFDTPDRTLKIPVADLKYLEVGTGSGMDTVVFKTEKKTTGFCTLKGGVQFLTPSGIKVMLEKQDIKKILFNESKEAHGRGRIDTTKDSGRTR
jgi:hypothetical protein